jgi:hypothetical protein
MMAKTLKFIQNPLLDRVSKKRPPDSQVAKKPVFLGINNPSESVFG